LAPGKKEFARWQKRVVGLVPSGWFERREPAKINRVVAGGWAKVGSRATLLRNKSMSAQPESLEVYQTGELTVVGFGGREILDQIDITQCRSQIISLVEQHKAKILAFDLAGVKLIPSGMLGLLASLRKMNIEVHLYNPSPDVEEVLHITKLKDLMKIHHLDDEKPKG
jgi:anti-anti-sigma factor